MIWAIGLPKGAIAQGDSGIYYVIADTQDSPFCCCARKWKSKISVELLTRLPRWAKHCPI